LSSLVTSEKGTLRLRSLSDQTGERNVKTLSWCCARACGVALAVAIGLTFALTFTLTIRQLER
jgi:hypothetical protein